MSYPDENLPLDKEGIQNEQFSQQDEQYSQQDVQSDGIDDVPPSEEDIAASTIDNLSQADKAAEASYTLDVDKGIAKGEPDRN